MKDRNTCQIFLKQIGINCKRSFIGLQPVKVKYAKTRREKALLFLCLRTHSQPLQLMIQEKKGKGMF